VAVFAFDARESLVWLDPIDTPGPGAGSLCAEHADRLSPPRGWNLLDRRATESRFWLGEPATVTDRTPRRPQPARSRPRSTPAPSLPFDGAEPASAAPLVATIVSVPDHDRAVWSPHDRPGADFERVVDARTPLLARAFEAVRHTYDG